MKKSVVLVLVGMFLSIAFVSAFSSWTLVGGNQYHTGHTSLRGNISNPQIMWSFEYPDETSNYFMNQVLVDDINSDGIMEACSQAKDGYVRCFNALNGTEVWNHSVPGVTSNLGGPSGVIANLYNNSERQYIAPTRTGFFEVINGTNGEQIWNFTSEGSVWITDMVSTYNFLGDDKQEVLFHTSYDGGSLYLFYSNGTQIWNYSLGLGYSEELGGVAIADLDNNGQAEIVASLGADNISIIDFDGNLVKSIEISPKPSDYSFDFGHSGIALTDFNNDSFLDIILTSDNGYVYGINSSLDLIWSKLSSIYILDGDSAAIGDIDNDSKPELVFSSYDNSATALNAEDGSVLWRSYDTHSSTGAPSNADIDNDGELEVINVAGGKLSFLNGKYGYSERSMHLLFEPHHSPPGLADVDGDGFVEIFVGGRSGGSYPVDWKNMIVGIFGGGEPVATSHLDSSILHNNSINWKVRGKNVLSNYDILDYLGNNETPLEENFANLENLEYSLIADDLDSDGNLEIFATNSSQISYIHQNGSFGWTFSSEKDITGAPQVADLDNDGVDDIVLIVNTTVFALNKSSGDEIWNYTHAETNEVTKEPFYVLDASGNGENDLFYTFKQSTSTVTIAINSMKSFLHINHISKNSPSNNDWAPVYDFDKDGILDFVQSAGSGMIILKRFDTGGDSISGVIQGFPVYQAIADINQDSYMDVIIGAKNLTTTSSIGSYSGFLSYRGNQSGIHGLTYNTTSRTLDNYFYYRTENVTGGIATSDLDGDGYSEIIFGDITNTLYAINSTGSHVWNVSLGNQLAHPPLILRQDDSRIIIANSNDTIYFINATGDIFYTYNTTSNLTYSPIILDLDKDCKGEVIFAETAGNISTLNFGSSENKLAGNLTFEIGNGTYQPKTLGKSLCHGVIVDVNSYSSDLVSLELDGDSAIAMSVTGLEANRKYTISTTSSGSSSDAYQTTNSDGILDISYSNIGSRVVEISPYQAQDGSDSGSTGGGSPSYSVGGDALQSGYTKSLGRFWKLNFEVGDESHQLKLNSLDNENQTVNITVLSTPQTKILSVDEEWKVNLDGDNDYDLLVRVDNITSIRAEVFIQEINEEIEAPIVDMGGSGETVEGSQDKVGENNYMFYIGIFVVVVVIAVLAWLFISKKSSKKKRK